MLTLMQLLKILSPFDRELLKAYFADIDKSNVKEEIDLLSDFLFNHCRINVELRDREKESLVRIVMNGTWKSAFTVADTLL